MTTPETRRTYLGVGACDVCWTASWVPVAPDDPEAREVIGGVMKGSHVRCDFCFQTTQLAEARAVLRQAYGGDEPISLPDLARKVVAKVAGTSVTKRVAIMRTSDAERALYQHQRQCHAQPVAMTITTKVPSKWRWLDLETGDVWRWAEERSTFTRAVDVLLERKP